MVPGTIWLIMNKIFIKNAVLINDGSVFSANVLIENERIRSVYRDGQQPESLTFTEIIDADGAFLLPGIIDDQVHFREPGLTHKAEIKTESRAAVAGGITSFMEMPNTIPQALTQEILEEKYKRAKEVSLANYSFYMGASNNNIDEVLKTNPENVCGIKVFMGSSTGNMLVDNPETLREIFSASEMLIATHCEDEAIIQANTKLAREKYGEDVPISMHPIIRSAEACYKSSAMAVDLAERYGTRLHVLHISTAKETGLFRNDIPTAQKTITAEVCAHHLWFTSEDYEKFGTRIKWNPAVKSEQEREGLRQALLDGRLDVIATDHAPHTLAEKQNSYFKAPSGGPLVQHSLLAMLDLNEQGVFGLPLIVEKMCHAPAKLFRIPERGYIREGYYADLVLVQKKDLLVQAENIFYKCGWSPFEGHTFKYSVSHTFVNGHCVYNNGLFNEEKKGMRLRFQKNSLSS